MKFIFLLFFPFFSFAQATTYEKGDSTWLVSWDTSIAKVYKVDNPLKALESPIRCLFIADKPKYDTIGPFWKQVSDLTPGYNPVMAMQLYEVRIYKSPITQGRKEDGWPGAVPYHFAWLDIKKKPFQLAVWEDKTLASITSMSLNDAIAASIFNGCPIPNPTFKNKKK